MKRDSVVIYRDLFEGLMGVPERSYKRIMNAVLSYAMNGVEPKLNGLEYALFRSAKSTIDANNRKYENGKQGGRPKTQNETNEEPSENQTETKDEPNNNQIETKENQNETKTNLNVKCKMLNVKGEMYLKEKERKKENNIYKKTNTQGARKKDEETYDAIVDEFGVKDRYREAIFRWIAHLQATGLKFIINERLKTIIVRLDVKYGDDDMAKISEIDNAIAKGYKYLPCEDM